jgi:uncharacterized protein
MRARCGWATSASATACWCPGRAPSRPDDLETAHFDAILALQPELVIFGSGPRLKFVSPALMRGLIDRRIGVETMDTPAACRTYNVLVSEGRSAVAALLMAPAA